MVPAEQREWEMSYLTKKQRQIQRQRRRPEAQQQQSEMAIDQRFGLLKATNPGKLRYAKRHNQAIYI